MAHKNQKIEKKKEYNPFVTRTIKRETVGKVKCWLKAVKQNTYNGYGIKKTIGQRYDLRTGLITFDKSVEIYNAEQVYYYEVGANDGSYRKCTTREDAERRFAQLVEFEKRQTEIK